MGKYGPEFDGFDLVTVTDQTLFWKFYILEQQAETGGDQVQTYCGQRRKKVDIMRIELDDCSM